jgi:starvation-inducible DNA-binding protein
MQKTNSLSSSYENTPQVLEILQILLSATLSLSNRVQEAHWNVKGTNFGPLHELFGEFYDFLTDSSDLLAERVVQLSGQAIANPAGGPLFGDEMTLLVSLKEATQELSEGYKAGIEASGDDEVSADVMIELGRETEKWLWKVESHTQNVTKI